MSKFPIEAMCGKETCASAPGKFCRFLYFWRMGSIPHCGAFSRDLLEFDGQVMRCEACLDHEISLAQEKEGE